MIFKPENDFSASMDDKFPYLPKNIIYPFKNIWIEYSIGKAQFGIAGFSSCIENNHSEFVRFVNSAVEFGKFSKNLIFTDPLPEVALLAILYIYSKYVQLKT